MDVISGHLIITMSDQFFVALICPTQYAQPTSSLRKGQSPSYSFMWPNSHICK